MKVLVIGSGGREHALGWKLSLSENVEKVYYAPGNGGTATFAENTGIDTYDFNAIGKFCVDNNVEFVVVGPDGALAEGAVDQLEKFGLKVFGPTQAAAKIESSKAFTADFLTRFNIPQPVNKTFTDTESAKEYVEEQGAENIVLKADGLALGKGVILPATQTEANQAIDQMMSGELFGDAGSTIVIQERLRGQEVSVFAISDGEDFVLLPYFQDHKPIFEGDKGPNTGGMGAYTPLPFVYDELDTKIRKIIGDTITGMKQDGTPFRGCLYGGLFVTEEGEPKVIEYNCRFGDPECQPMMLALDSDLLPLLLASAQGNISKLAETTKISNDAAATVCLASAGYPESSQKGIEIHGLEKDYEGVTVFHAGTKLEGGKFYTNGGRVLNITARGNDLKDALSKIYAVIGENGIHFDGMQYRRDIGFRVL